MIAVSDVTQSDTLAAPCISFTGAMRARFTWRGQLHIVGTCDLGILGAFLVLSAGRARLPVHQLREVIACLDFGEVGRWQAIDSMLVYGVALPVCLHSEKRIDMRENREPSDLALSAFLSQWKKRA